jgi:transmembrane sensor
VSAVERIEEEASRWLAVRDTHADAANDSEFNRWLDADIRHRVAYLKLEAAWQRSERLRELKPLDRAADPDLLRIHRRPWPAAIAASVSVLALAIGAWAYVEFRWQRYETPVGGLSRVVLDDGSIIDLNTNSAVRVRLRRIREVELERGEGRFEVAPDSARPFVVTAAGANVRALGTAFTVRLRAPARVDVVVSEGRVAIASEQVSRAPPLYANEAAVVLPNRVSVTRIGPQLLARRLAWTSGRIVLQGETLSEAIAEFNRYNARQLAFEPAIATLPVAGNFTATDPESFAAALASAFHLRIDPSSGEAIVLRSPAQPGADDAALPAVDQQ